MDKMKSTGEPVTGRNFNGNMVQVLTKDFNETKPIMYNDSSFDLEQYKNTMPHVYLDHLSCRNETGSIISGRGGAAKLSAISATSPGTTGRAAP